MQNFLVVIQAVLPVFMVIGLGSFLYKIQWLPHDLERNLFRIVLNVLMPCFILDSMLGNEALRIPQNIFFASSIGFLLCLLGAALGLLGARFIGLTERSSQCSFAFSISIFNYGYIAIPLAQTIFDKETVGMLFVLNLGVEIALWTLGALLLSRQSVFHAMRQINYSVIFAIILGVTLNFTHANEWMPRFILKAIHMVGAPANPLALLLIGSTFAASLQSFSFHSGGRTMFSSIFLRNIALPFLFILLAKYLPIAMELKRVLILQAAMPAALYPLVLIKHYHGDAVTGLRVIVSSTLFGLLTIPLIIKFGLSWVFP